MRIKYGGIASVADPIFLLCLEGMPEAQAAGPILDEYRRAHHAGQAFEEPWLALGERMLADVRAKKRGTAQPGPEGGE